MMLTRTATSCLACSFSSVLYKHVMGDKDTFGYAFALAEKLHELYFVATPPGAAFKDEVGAGHLSLWLAVRWSISHQTC